MYSHGYSGFSPGCLLVVLAVAATMCVVIVEWLLFSDTANAEARCTVMATVASVSACLLVALAIAATVCVVIADWLLFSDSASAEARCTVMATVASVSACLLVMLTVAATVCSYR